MPDLDPHTPVLVGVGQSSERLHDPEYQGHSAVALATNAAHRAITDAGATGIAAEIDTVAGIRQFENSFPETTAPLGKSDNYPRAVATRLGASPRRAILDVIGGQAPQHLVTEMAATIARGDSDVALVLGSEAISTTRHLAGSDEAPDFTEHVGGQLEDRGYGLDGLLSDQAVEHGLIDPPSQYALFENARRARLGQSRETYAHAMGELFAPFTKIAAANPHAAAPVERDAQELATPTGRNRPIADPYTRFLVARDQVNQGAATLLMSVGAARRLGVPEHNWVFLHGHADLQERTLMARNDLATSPAAALAVRHALDVAGIDLADVSAFDLYSCFPIAVFNICDTIGLSPDDPRGLTLTGGLPFFGGAGNNYSMHAIAEAVGRARAEPGAYALVGANGGLMSKYSVGIYSTTPTDWHADHSAQLQDEVDSRPSPSVALQPEGPATIESYTVQHGRDGTRSGIVIGRLAADNRRFVATADDDTALDMLSHGEPIGRQVYVRSAAGGNRVTVGGPTQGSA